MIPLTLFQTDRDAPPDEYVQKWKRANPGLEWVFFDDNAARDYLNEAWGPTYAEAFELIVPGAIKADFVRLCYIADRGGFYCDTDNAPGEIPLTNLTQHELVVCDSTFAGHIFNAFFGAKPEHPELIALAKQAHENVMTRRYCYGGFSVTAIAGPQLMTPLLDVPGALVLHERPMGTVVTDDDRTVAVKIRDNMAEASHWTWSAFFGYVYTDCRWRSARAVWIGVAVAVVLVTVIALSLRFANKFPRDGTPRMRR